MTFLRFFEVFVGPSEPVAEDAFSFEGEPRLSALVGEASLPFISFGSVISGEDAPLDLRAPPVIKRGDVGRS